MILWSFKLSSFKRAILISAVTLLILIPGCSSNSVFMDALPLGEGKNRVTIGASLRGNFTCDEDSVIFRNIDHSFFPLDLLIQTGSYEQTDLLFKYTFPLTVGVGFKHTFTSEPSLRIRYSALGLNIHIDAITLLADTIDTRPVLFSMSAQYYETYRFFNCIGFSLVPDLSFRIDKHRVHLLTGGNINLNIGTSWGMMVEGSCLHNLFLGEPEYQLGAAVYFPFARQPR